MERVIDAAAARDDYNDAGERQATLQYLERARDGYRALAAGRGPAPAARVPAVAPAAVAP
ncbi:MAG: hypothetical protein U1F30_13285 [Steroidobacteraceae bacterium]